MGCCWVRAPVVSSLQPYEGAERAKPEVALALSPSARVLSRTAGASGVGEARNPAPSLWSLLSPTRGREGETVKAEIFDYCRATLPRVELRRERKGRDWRVPLVPASSPAQTSDWLRGKVGAVPSGTRLPCGDASPWGCPDYENPSARPGLVNPRSHPTTR